MALIYRCLRPNNHGTSVKHPLMAFKICHLIVILSNPLMDFSQNRYLILSNLHSCWRLQVQTRPKQAANTFVLGESAQCTLNLATLRVKDSSLSLTRPLSQFTNKSRCGQQCPVQRIMNFIEFTMFHFYQTQALGSCVRT